MKRLFIIAVLLLLLPSAYALTVSPAKFETTSQGEQEFTFTIRNNEPATVNIAYEGELAPYAQGSQSIFVEGEQKTTITVSPPELSSGPHFLNVILSSEARGGQVGAITELSPRIIYNIPYTTAYLDYTLGIQDGKDPLDVTLMLTNLGVEETAVQPSFIIEGIGGPYTTELVQLTPGVTARTTASLPEDITATGEYTLTLTLYTDAEAKQKTETRQVFLGKPKIILNSASVQGEPGEVLPIDLSVRTLWNKPLVTSLSASIIGDDRQWVLQPQELLLIDQQEIRLFWESDDAQQEAYDLQLTFTMEGFTQNIVVPIEIEPQPITTDIPWLIIVLILLFILFLLSTAYFLLFKNK